MKSLKLIIGALLLPLAVLAQPGRAVPGAGMMQRQPQATAIDAELQKLLVAESAISNLYVEDVDEKKIVEQAIKGMLEELDPHSTYLTAQENDKSNETLMGSFEGIGVQFNMIDDTLFIVQPIPDGQTGFYRITVLPVKRNLDKEFAGKTVMEVEKSLKAEYIDSYEKRAVYTFINPEVKHGREYYKIYFCDDALVLVRRVQLGRDNWIKAGGDEDSYIAVIADGKEYRMVANNGLQDFGDYEYHDEYGYANGSYFWCPESGEIYTAMVFEPVPLDVKGLDVVSVSKENNTSSYISRGVRTSIDRDFLKDTRIVNVKGDILL